MLLAMSTDPADPLGRLAGLKGWPSTPSSKVQWAMVAAKVLFANRSNAASISNRPAEARRGWLGTRYGFVICDTGWFLVVGGLVVLKDYLSRCRGTLGVKVDLS